MEPVKVSDLIGKYGSSDICVFDFAPSGPNISLYFTKPTSDEILAVQSGPFSIGYVVRGCVIFAVFKIGKTWMDAPFSIRRHDGLGHEFDFSKEFPAGHGYSLKITLKNVLDNSIKATRTVVVSTDFSNGLRSEILKQFEQPFSDSLYDRTIDSVYNSYTSVELSKIAKNLFTIKQ
jgi:hypothetical protein